MPSFASFTSPTNNGHASEQELDRTIGRLNGFGLRLRGPDPTLSPSRRRPQRRTEEEDRNDAIYQRIRNLHYKKDRRLASCLGRFEAEARELLPTTTQRGISAQDRAALQLSLLDILPDPHAVNPPKWAKRLNDEIPNPAPKRARGQPDHDHAYHGALDELPVRSRAVPGSDAHPNAGTRETRGAIHSTFQNVSFASRSFASSRASYPSDVFSSVHTEDVTSMSQTTIDSDYPDNVTHKSYPACAKASHAAEDLFSRKDGAVTMQVPDLPDRSLERPGLSSSASVESTWARADLERREYSDSSEMAGLDISTNVSYTANQGGGAETLEDKLANIWPKFPGPGLNHAPLAVIWEVTRAALHCGVTLDKLDLKYEPDDEWHEQTKLRSMLSKHHLFAGKSLPEPNESIAWRSAMNEFHSKAKTVALSAQLVHNRNQGGPLYDLRLNPLGLELGHRLARRFGADRFLEVNIPSPTSSNDQPDTLKNDKCGLEKIVRWLTRERHYFLGRCWVPFYVRNVKGKKGKGKKPQGSNSNSNDFQERIYFFACYGNIFRSPSPGCIPPQEEASTPGNRTNMKLSDFLGWAVNIKANSHQPVTKLFSRLALSVSRTWPTVVLERSQIRIRTKDLGTVKVMNDGIGCMSRSLAEKVAKSLGLSDCPSCFQARLGSGKGIWIIDVNDCGLEDDWIEIYPSQNKWECDFLDPQHRTFEVRNWPSELKSATLNQQFIPVLEAQSLNPAAMREAIADHLINGLLADLDAQTTAMKEPVDLRLWVQQSGLSKSDRFHGYAQFLAGLPDSNADKVAFLLDSGFDQRKMIYLKDLVWDMCKRKAEMLKSKMNIEIPCSAYVYMVADFSSTLEEGEVHLSFSTKFQVEGFSDTLLENMDVLVARAPAHLPSDIQRVRIVSQPELRRLKDVIVFSTKGDAPLADMLSGGDYDGDLAWVCWDRNIVNNFRSVPIPKLPDLFERGYLRKSNTKFKDMLENTRMKNLHMAVDPKRDILHACHDFIYEAFLFNLQPSFLGRCTKYKERMCYHDRSVTNEASIVLSALLGLLVDQGKQGIIFTNKDWQRLRQEVLKKPKIFDEPEYAKERGSANPGPRRKVHVLDYLKYEVANAVIEDALRNFEKAINTSDVMNYDADLTRLFNAFEKKAERSGSGKKLLKHLKDELEPLERLWKQTNAGASRADGSDFSFNTNTKQLYQKWLDIKPPEELLSSKLVQELLQDWGEDSNTSPWELLKASATFKHYYGNNAKFIWYMAGRQLAFIKARMRQVPKETAPVLVIPEMWGVLRPDKKLIMTLAAQRAASRDLESAVALEEVMEFDDDGTVIDDV